MSNEAKAFLWLSLINRMLLNIQSALVTQLQDRFVFVETLLVPVDLLISITTMPDADPIFHYASQQIS